MKSIEIKGTARTLQNVGKKELTNCVRTMVYLVYLYGVQVMK